MSVEKGSAFLLKIGNGDVPLTYATIAGLRTTQLQVSFGSSSIRAEPRTHVENAFLDFGSR